MWDEIERCCSAPQGDHAGSGLHAGLHAQPELRRCHSMSQLKLLETAVFEMEDRYVMWVTRRLMMF